MVVSLLSAPGSCIASPPPFFSHEYFSWLQCTPPASPKYIDIKVQCSAASVFFQVGAARKFLEINSIEDKKLFWGILFALRLDKVCSW